MPRSRIIFLAILGAAVLVVVLITVVAPQVQQSNLSQGQTATASNITTIYVNYGTEKKNWLEETVRRFEAVNPTIRVTLIGEGSMESYQALSQLTDSSIKMGSNPIPALWSPAAEIQVNLLNDTAAVGRPLAVECERLVLSPLAFMMWEDRAKAFETYFKDKGGITFQNLHDALSDPAIAGNWAKLGGDPNWGLIKVGFTDPRRSNSGTMMLIAMANNYAGKTGRVTSAEVAKPEFGAWMAVISNAISQPLRNSSGTLMQDYIAKGPASYDVVIIYEALAIEYFKNAVGRHGQSLRIVYPQYNLYSDHPICRIDHPAVTPAQQAAGKTFVDFLTGTEMQTLALTYGYRPADLNIPLFGASTAFDDPDMKAAGIGANIGQEVTIPDGATINNLITVWQRGFTN